MCQQRSNPSQAQVVLQWQTLLDTYSQWKQGCPEITHLPKYLAMYMRDTYSRVLSVNIPRQGALTWAEVTQVCDLLEASNIEKGIHCHLAVYHSLEIQHPDLPGRMMLRAHPFTQLPYHGKQ